MTPARPALAIACLVAGCTIQGNVFPPGDAGPRPTRDAGLDARPRDSGFDAALDAPSDAGRPPVCFPGPSGDVAPLTMSASPVVIDGTFTGAEWAGVEPLEGLYADVYLDVRDGDLVLLNDWRANTEGIDGDCFNLFEITIDGAGVTIRLFRDGRVEVEGTSRLVTGAYGFGPSPQSPFDHTIFELSISAADAPPIHVCLFDPLALVGCDGLAEEPMVFSVVPGGPDDPTLVQRSTLTPGLTRLTDGEACATGDGVCQAGLRCSPSGPMRLCTPG